MSWLHSLFILPATLRWRDDVGLAELGTETSWMESSLYARNLCLVCGHWYFPRKRYQDGCHSILLVVACQLVENCQAVEQLNQTVATRGPVGLAEE